MSGSFLVSFELLDGGKVLVRQLLRESAPDGGFRVALAADGTFFEHGFAVWADDVALLALVDRRPGHVHAHRALWAGEKSVRKTGGAETPRPVMQFQPT